jgi:adenylate cyclase
MRGFTKLSTSQSCDVVLECINAVFEVVVEAVQAQGGQVLKFMGDGLLATFGNPSDHLACIAVERVALQA